MTVFQLTINERQARLIAGALDLYSRIRAGQLRAIEDVLDLGTWEQTEAVRQRIEHLREAAGFPGYDDFNRPDIPEAFNLRKLLEHGVSWTNNPEGGYTVNFDGPIGGKWEDTPAVMLRFEGDEARRIRDRADKTTSLGDDLADLIGTSDIATATERVRAWKQAADEQGRPANYASLPAKQKAKWRKKKRS